MSHTGFGRWLMPPPLSGRMALLCIVVVLGLATMVRAAIASSVEGCEFTPYLPAVLFSAFLLRWWQASLVGLLSIPVLGLLFLGTPAELSTSSCFISSTGVFLAVSMSFIGFVALLRRIIVSFQKSGADESSGGVLFSLHQGEVWASWHGKSPRLLLGSEQKVSAMMADFLAQGEVAKRLNCSETSNEA